MKKILYGELSFLKNDDFIKDEKQYNEKLEIACAINMQKNKTPN